MMYQHQHLRVPTGTHTQSRVHHESMFLFHYQSHSLYLFRGITRSLRSHGTIGLTMYLRSYYSTSKKNKRIPEEMKYNKKYYCEGGAAVRSFLISILIISTLMGLFYLLCHILGIISLFPPLI